MTEKSNIFLTAFELFMVWYNAGSSIQKVEGRAIFVKGTLMKGLGTESEFVCNLWNHFYNIRPQSPKDNPNSHKIHS